MKTLLLILLASSAWAGQSIQTTGSKYVAAVIASQSKATTFKHVVYIHDWDEVQTGAVMLLSATGVQINKGTGTRFEVYSLWDASGYICEIETAGWASKRLYLSFERNVATSAQNCEAWRDNGDGSVTQVVSATVAIGANTASASSNYEILAFRLGATGAVGFIRTYNTGTGLTGNIPKTFDNAASRFAEYKFDGNITDALGTYNMIEIGTGTVSYISQVGQQAFSVPKANPKSWSASTSLRAGFPQSLDGSASFSQSDSTSAVTYSWSQVVEADTPSRVQWLTAQTLVNPTVSGLVAGPYKFRLVATDANGSSSVDISVGAVATDANGVVIPASTDVDYLFGPMIALGKNPWGYADYHHQRTPALRAASPTKAGETPDTVDGIPTPIWGVWKPGTVSYTRRSRVATLNGSITSSATTITLNSVAALDLTSLPGTPIILNTNESTGGEFILICSASGTTLTVCYDGRGWGNSTAAALANGVTVYQSQVLGSGTDFSTLCPAGYPGVAGSVYYHTGTVALTPGSTTVTLSGGSWSGLFGGRYIQVAATQGGGTAYSFIATINSIDSATTATMSRAYPASADSVSGRTYAMILPDRLAALEWSHPTIATGGASPRESSTIQLGVMGCTSATRMYTNNWQEGLGSGQTETAVRYAVTAGTWVSDFDNFYDEVLANYALWFRSGDAYALQQARRIGRWWIAQPAFCGGYCYNFPRRINITGAFVVAALDPTIAPAISWPILRVYAEAGNYAALNDTCAEELRETAFKLSWLALAAKLDPDSGQRSGWQTKLANSYTRDNGCKGANNNHPIPIFRVEQTGLTMTSGSATVTGTGIPSSMCVVDATGTITLTNGSTTGTITSGTMTAGKLMLVLGARPDGSPWHTLYTYTSGTTVTFDVPFAGTTGSYSWQIRPRYAGPWDYLTFWNGVGGPVDQMTDPNFGKIFTCTWVSSSQITLDRNWPGPTVTSTGQMGRYNVNGVGTQGFILALKTNQMRWAKEAGQSGYSALLTGAGNWLNTVARNTTTKGWYYWSGAPQCEPQWDNLLDCGHNSLMTASIGEGRTLGAEMQNALSTWYIQNPTTPNRLVGDETYASIWSKFGYDDSAPASDAITGIDANGINLGNPKWYGFFFGMGMAHQWPAARLGGVQPPVLVAKPIKARLADISGAVDIVVDYLAPSGLITTSSPCTSSACTFDVNTVQGTYQYRVRYRNGSAVNLAVGKWTPVN